MNRLCSFSLGVFCALASPSLAVLPFGISDASAANGRLEVSRTSPEHTRISLRSPQISVTTETMGYENYQVFALEGEPPVPREGCPSVPQISRFYRIPNTGCVELNLETLGFDLLENVNALPYHADESSTQKDAAVYDKDAWYPSDVVQISAPMVLRDFRVVQVTLYPVQVNPVTHQARVYHTMDMSLVANSQPGRPEITRVRRPSGAWSSTYRSLIANLDDSALDDATTTPGSMLILTNSDVSALPWADSLAEWKTRKGYRVTIDARDSWTAPQAITAVRTAYVTSDPPLEFVVLMGDAGSTWGVPVDGNNFDHSYALADTLDDLEDIGIGRLSGSTATAMATINAKIMMYERMPHMDSAGVADTTWYHRAFLYAGVSRGCAGNYLLMRWGQDQFTGHTGVDSALVEVHTASQIDMAEASLRFNTGIGFFFWRSCFLGDMPDDFADQLLPRGRFPITMTMEANSGYYGGSGINSPAEDMLCAGTPANPRGGICGIGLSEEGENPISVCMVAGFIYSVATLQTEHLGTALSSAKTMLYSSYGVQGDPEGGVIATNESRWVNLLGDPSLSIWTDVPKVLTVDHPDSLLVGASTVDVTVRLADNSPVENALVVLWKKSPDSTWVKGLTDAAGHVTLPVHVTAMGGMFLTITKQNHKPYLHTIPCVGSGALPMLSNYAVDDDNVGGTQGNGDHLLNPGETIDLPNYFRNFGNTTITGIAATLSSGNPHITIISSTSTYPDLLSGDSAQCVLPYRIHASTAMRHHESAMLTLTTVSSAGQTTGPLTLECQAAAVACLRQQLGAPLNPGATASLSVFVQNTGVLSLQSVTAQLVSLNPFVQVIAGTSSLGDIIPGALDSNSANPFTVSAGATAYRGQQAAMRLILSTASGFADTAQFLVSVGAADSTDPTGPDAYGYYAYDNADTVYALHPVYDYVSITADGTNLNLFDPGDKTTVTPIYSAVQRLPFNFKFYGQVYDSITICSNGWCAFGDQSYMDLFRNYPIPGMGAPDAMIAPYWDDLKTGDTGLGVWVLNDSTNHRFIIQWQAAAGQTYTTLLDFEVLLYDTTYAPTPDGNGRIVLQYRAAPMNLLNQHAAEAPGCTIGIVAPGGLNGLQYAYQNSYAPGAVRIDSGRAILFTTERTANPNAARPNPSTQIPARLCLYPTYPNPFNPTTQIRFDLPQTQRVTLRIYNALGQEVATVVDENRAAGSYAVLWDGTNASTGLYFCRLEAGRFVQTRKMLLIK